MIPSNAPTPIFPVEVFKEPVATVEGDTPIHLATPISLFL